MTAERRLSEFNSQDVANTAWSYATVNYQEEKQCAVLAVAAEWQLSNFNPQHVANLAWAFATVNYRDLRLFAAPAMAARRRLSDFKSLPTRHGSGIGELQG